METYSKMLQNGKTAYWEVPRIIEEAKKFEPIKYPLNKIEQLDKNLWFGEKWNTKPTCRSVANHAKRIYEADLSYPIILSENEDVMDGMHRVAKAYLEGKKEILAIIFPKTPDPDWYE